MLNQQWKMKAKENVGHRNTSETQLCWDLTNMSSHNLSAVMTSLGHAVRTMYNRRVTVHRKAKWMANSRVQEEKIPALTLRPESLYAHVPRPGPAGHVP